MLKTLVFFAPCAVIGYVAYPDINEGIEQRSAVVADIIRVPLLNSINNDQVVGSWTLSPRSASIVSKQLGTSGRRAGIELEAWGGGTAFFVVGDRRIEGPISWTLKSKSMKGPASLIIHSGKDKITLNFSRIDDNQITLIAEPDSIIPGVDEHVRFLKVS